MDNLIERYIYDVIRRLPEKEQDEVSKELRANIYDMLPNDENEEGIKAVLYELGKPSELAEKYRQSPRYLISPAFYDDYIRVLKWLLPLVGVIVFCIGAVIGVIGVAKEGAVDFADLIGESIGKAISMGISAAFQAFLWTTIGFVIAERSGSKVGKEQGWKIEDLPEMLPNDKKKISLADSITELALTVVAYTFVISVCSGLIPVAFVIQHAEVKIPSIFNYDFLISCIPAIVIMAVLDIWGCISKIRARRWSPFVCWSIVIGCLINMSISLYLINSPELFSTEGLEALTQALKQDLLLVVGFSNINMFTGIISFIIVFCSLAECSWTVYKTIKK